MVHASVRSSRIIASVLLIVHTGAAAILIPLDLPLWWKTAVGAAIAASLLHSICQHALRRTRRGVVAIEVRDQCAAAIAGRDGSWRDARILGSTWVSPWLTVLNLKVHGERFATHVVLVADSIDREDFRKLRVLLRWSRVPETAHT